MAGRLSRTFVFVPGGWHGGWVFDEVCAALRDRGHDARAVTLTGLAPGADGRAANLATHVDDVVRFLAGRSHVVLCGHSYGGMVVRGVADRCPERLLGLGYIDAYVPMDGDSCWHLTSDRYRDIFVTLSRRTGFLVDPPPGVDPRAMPHPLASFTQGLPLSRATVDLPQCYVYLSQWQGSPFRDVYQRLRDDPAWRTVELPTSHNIMREDPELLVNTLLAQTADWHPRPSPPGR
jgi:pimeloyl-ACP methyl ester carboxylesterase